MSDFPYRHAPQNAVTLSTEHAQSMGLTIRSGCATAPASAASPANRAYYIPFVVYKPFTVKQMWTFNGATASGNLDVGVYDSNGTRLVSNGAAAQSGTSTLQVFNITDITIQAGQYYMAVSNSSATATYFRYSMTVTQQTGMLIQDTAHPLPATATFAAAITTVIPIIGLTGSTTL